MPGREKEPDPEAVDAFLAGLPDDQRTALERLRGQIRSAAPDAVERMGYGMPMFYVGSSTLVGFSAWKNHLAIYGIGPALAEANGIDLEDYDTEKGTVRFTPERPLPAALVRKLIKARLAEHASR